MKVYMRHTCIFALVTAVIGACAAAPTRASPPADTTAVEAGAAISDAALDRDATTADATAAPTNDWRDAGRCIKAPEAMHVYVTFREMPKRKKRAVEARLHVPELTIDEPLFEIEGDAGCYAREVEQKIEQGRILEATCETGEGRAHGHFTWWYSDGWINIGKSPSGRMEPGVPLYVHDEHTRTVGYLCGSPKVVEFQTSHRP